MVLPSSSWCVEGTNGMIAGFLLEALRWKGDISRLWWWRGRKLFPTMRDNLWWRKYGCCFVYIVMVEDFLKKRGYESAECKNDFFFKCIKFVLYIYWIFVRDILRQCSDLGQMSKNIFFYFMDLNWPHGLFLWLETFSITCQNIYTWYYHF